MAVQTKTKGRKNPRTILKYDINFIGSQKILWWKKNVASGKEEAQMPCLPTNQ
jgi:hypothetical protein